jgi:PhnB protein
MNASPYLFFDGSCEQALQFYQQALGAQVDKLIRYKESPEPPPPGCAPADGERILYASLRVGESLVNVSDTPEGQAKKPQGFAISLEVQSAQEAQQRFDALAAGGQVFMPVGKTFFSPAFGMLTDRFGVQWMVVSQ